MFRHRSRSALLAVAVIALQGVFSSPMHAQGAPFCPPGQPPRFLFGFAALQAQLGATMGAPLECEHGAPSTGHTIQHTSTGLAYYIPEINTPIFTDGATHWALSGGELILWRNASVAPPRPTAGESAYLTAISPLVARSHGLSGQLARMIALGQDGLIDTLGTADVASILDALAKIRVELAAATASDRLSSYDATILAAMDAAQSSAELVLRARLTDLPAARAAFLAEASAQLSERDRLMREASFAYSLALPIASG